MNTRGILSLLNDVEALIGLDNVNAKLKLRIVIDTFGWDKAFLALNSEVEDEDGNVLAKVDEYEDVSLINAVFYDCVGECV